MMHVLLAVLFWGNAAISPPPRLVHLPQTDGKAVFDANCRKCHGVRGIAAASAKRNMPNLPNLDASFLSKRTMQTVTQDITKGKGDMKPFADRLSAEEISAVAQYIYQLANTTPKAAK